MPSPTPINIVARNHREFGFLLGQALRKEIQSRLARNKKIYRQHGFKDFSLLTKTARKFLPAIEKYHPQILDEIQGMSRGAKIPLTDLLVLICEEELIDYKIPHCTGVAAHLADGTVALAHNEDWLPDYRHNGLCLIRGQIKDNHFLALSYIGSLAGSSCGLNNKGFAYTGNSLACHRFRYGVPRSVQLRALLDASTQQDVLIDLQATAAGICGNFTVASPKQLVDVEDLWQHQEIFRGKNYLIHTNHPLAKHNQKRNNTDQESVNRYQRIEEILASEPTITEETLQQILCDHRAGICGHSDRKHPQLGVTIASAIVNVSRQAMKVCLANPCCHSYTEFSLAEPARTPSPTHTDMIMEIPYHPQKTIYTCGPAVLQMVLAYFGKRMSQKALAKLMRTSKKSGTKNQALIKAATKEGFYCYVNDDSSLFEIEHFIAAGLQVIVDYIEPSYDDPHYAIVIGFDESDLIFNDPWNGKDFRLSREEFLKRWRDTKNVHQKWIMVIAKENFEIGKQYLPKRPRHR